MNKSQSMKIVKNVLKNYPNVMNLDYMTMLHDDKKIVIGCGVINNKRDDVSESEMIIYLKNGFIDGVMINLL